MHQCRKTNYPHPNQELLEFHLYLEVLHEPTYITKRIHCLNISFPSLQQFKIQIKTITGVIFQPYLTTQNPSHYQSAFPFSHSHVHTGVRITNRIRIKIQAHLNTKFQEVIFSFRFSILLKDTLSCSIHECGIKLTTTGTTTLPNEVKLEYQ